MFYIHQSSCISPQQTFGNADLSQLHDVKEKKLTAIEPSYDFIPPGSLRRMGKAVRMGVGAALSLLQQPDKPNGIILGTVNLGKEDCVNFLNQIIEYDEGMLTPLNFVQGTPNGLAGQIGLLTKNHGYNITHMHMGLAFENAMIDAVMLLQDNPSLKFLIGAVDDIGTYNYYFEDKSGWYKEKAISNSELYTSGTSGSIAGEAAVMFLVDGNAAGAVAIVNAVETFHSNDELAMKDKLEYFLKTHLPEGEKISLLLSGENGDARLRKYFDAAENSVGDGITIARYKHMCGEFPTASAVGLWLACNILQEQTIPGHMIKLQNHVSAYKYILLYNNYKGTQHSFILVSC